MGTPKSLSQAGLKKMLSGESGKNLKIIDVRSKEDYDKQHIPGAINVPSEELEYFMKNKKDEVTVVTVCNRGGNRSKDAAATFSLNGNDAFFLEGGTLGWFENNGTVSK